jgi:predicted phage terminase large subunit-like protein
VARLAEDHRKQILRAGHSNLDAFGRIFMPRTFYAETPPFHHRIDKLLLDKSIKKKGIIAPRGSAKSTKSSVMFPMRRTCYNNPDNDLLIILISEAQSQSIAFMNIIGWNLAHNPRVKAVFGNLVGDKWREDEISTTNNVRIIARGTGQRVRGTVSGREGITRPNLIILDDFESETNSYTPEAIDKNKKWIAGAVEPSLADDGEMIATGTIISDRAYLADIRNDPSWTVLYFQALMNANADGPGNVPIFPSRFSYEDIMAKKASLESRGQGAMWWREYMNICNDQDRATFKKDWFKKDDSDFTIIDGMQPVLLKDVDGHQKCIPLYITMGVDLAISEQHSADYSVIAIVGQDIHENFYVLDYWRERTGDTSVIVDKMFELAGTYMVDLINIETVQFQQAVANDFYKKMHQKGRFYGVIETRPRSSKDARIKSLQPYFAGGQIAHRSWMGDLERELEFYPNSAHKDLLDAVYYAVVASSPPSIGEYARGQAAGKPRERERNAEVVDWLVL